MFCKYCGSEIDDGSKFFNSCGGDLTSDNGNKIHDVSESVAVSPVDSRVEPYVKHWEFVTSVGGSGNAYTMIDANDTTIKIEKFNSYMFFKWGQKSATFDVREINSIHQEKKMRPLMVVCMSLSVLCAIISGGISIIVAILCFLQRYDKSIVIQHKHGTVKITDCTGTSAEITEFFDYVRKYNPDSIRINM